MVQLCQKTTLDGSTHEEVKEEKEPSEKEIAPTITRKMARGQQSREGKENQGITKEQISKMVQSSKDLIKLMDSMSKSIDKQSKSIERLGTQVASLQDRLADTERTVNNAMTFMKNRGWKKEEKRKEVIPLLAFKINYRPVTCVLCGYVLQARFPS